MSANNSPYLVTESFQSDRTRLFLFLVFFIKILYIKSLYYE